MATIVGTSDDDNLIGTVGNDVMYGLGGDDWIQASAGSDIIFGNEGNDALDGKGSFDTLIGGTGSDTYVVYVAFPFFNDGDVIVENTSDPGDVDKILSFETWDMGTYDLDNDGFADAVDVENMRLVGEYVIFFTPVTNLMYLECNPIDGTGNDQSNTLEGNLMQNTLAGGLGNDTYIIHDLPNATNANGDFIFDTVSETSGQGSDTILFDPYVKTLLYTLPDYTITDVENLTLGALGVNGTGNTGDNTLTGNNVTNILTGLDGNDTYVIQSTADKAVEALGSLTAGGVDTISCGFTYSLAALPSVENIKLTGTVNANATGNGAVNILSGNDGANTLDGGTSVGGAGDTYRGSLGNDIYIVNETTDQAIADADHINPDEGLNTIKATLPLLALVAQTYNMTLNAAFVDNIILLGSAATNAIGNAQDNVMTGNAAINSLDGAGGNDTLLGLGGNDVLVSGTGTNLLDGGVGVDTMTGGSGNDTFIVDISSDTILSGGGGIDLIKTSVSFNMSSNATDVKNLLVTGGVATTINGGIIGNDLDNEITGNSGVNIMSGGIGKDTIVSGGGNDTMNGDAGDDTLVGSAGNELIRGGDDNDSLSGGAGADTLFGGNGNDSLSGGNFSDTMYGEEGNDTYDITDLQDIVIESSLTSVDLVKSHINSYTLGNNIENLDVVSGAIGIGNSLNNIINGNGGNNTLSGLVGDDTINGGGGNDTLDGGTGADTMTGASGNDTFIVDNFDTITHAGDTAIGGGGTDLVLSSVDFDMSFNATAVNNLTLTGTTAVFGTGNALDNVITGNNNVLANTLTGGTGNDTYVMDNTFDHIVENVTTTLSAEGTKDAVMSSVDFDLSAAPYAGQEIENLTLTGVVAIIGKGNDLDNIITGNGISNTLTGFLGNDTYVIGVQNVAGPDTQSDVIAFDTGGNDTVSVASTYSIAGSLDLENITLTGSANIDSTGNTNVNILAGNTGNNVMDAGASGGLGDTYFGSFGNDTYMVDEATDTVIEDVTLYGTDLGTDLIIASVNYDMTTLAANVDNLTLTGTAVIGTGNLLSNVITGDSLTNTLTGLDGNDVFHGEGGGEVDTMFGGIGSDTFFVDNALDVVDEQVGGGGDLVSSSVSYDISTGLTNEEVEGLTLTGAAIFGIGNIYNNTITGNANNNTLVGSGGNDILNGNDGDDTLDGGNGIDTLTGGNGIDTLDGGAGNDTLVGSGGADTMIGGAGNDTFMFDSLGGDLIIEAGGGGTDIIVMVVGASLDLRDVKYPALGAMQEIENLTLMAGTGNYNGTGNNLVNVIIGNGGNNTLDGGTGNDTVVGNGGNDTYFVDALGDVILGAGRAFASNSYDMSSNAVSVVYLTLTGSNPDTGTGNGLGNTITGFGTVDFTFNGNGGDDVFLLNSIDNVVTDAVDAAGVDLIIVSSTVDLNLGNVFSYDMSALAVSVDSLTVTGTHTFDVTDNAYDNTLTGNAALNHFFGSAGNDTYFIDTIDLIVDTGPELADINAGTGDIIAVGYSASLTADAALLGAAHWQGIDGITLTGTATLNATGDGNANILTGNSGVNKLDGKGGDDLLIGGAGNDTYYVDSTTDLINEVTLGGAGVDLVYATGVDYTLSTAVDNLTLIGPLMDLNGFGNSITNIIIGTTGNNTLDGATGTDTMNGGAGNDTYFVDSSDIVVDSAGHDTVVSEMHTYTLGSAMEDLILGLNAFDGYGNSKVNVITGNGEDNTIDGLSGADSMFGGDGNDTFFVDNTGDRVYEDPLTPPPPPPGYLEGTNDLISAKFSFALDANTEATFRAILAGVGVVLPDLPSEFDPNGAVEDMTVTGSAPYIVGNDLDNIMTGNSAVNTMYGGNGNDVLNGGGGKDIYYGGFGIDTFVINADATTNPKTIRDWDNDILRFEINFDPLQNVLEDFIASRYDPTHINSSGPAGATLYYIDDNGITVNGANFKLAVIIEHVDIT